MGIVRVSKVGGREGESFVSPEEQRGRIEAACERDGLELVAVYEEIDVSGGTALEERIGLRSAVETIEAGDADALMVAYFDRLVRSLRVQDEVVSRVEAAGGRVMALDFGQVTGATATQWLSGTMVGAFSEYYRRSVGERASAAQARVVARGGWPCAVPAGYLSGPEKVLVPDPDTSGAVAEAFNMRLARQPVPAIREYLRENGVRRSLHGVTHLLGNRVYLGEIHFGELVNLSAHEPLVEREVFEAVQKTRVSRGRYAKSQRLLARLGVLRCGTCGSRMVASTSSTQNYYRCPSTSDCERRMYVSADVAEGVVVTATRKALADLEGKASVADDARKAQAAAAKAQAELDAAIRVLAGVKGEAAARERLAELVAARDTARSRAEHLSRLHSALRITIADDWDRLTLEERRGLVKAAIARAVVGPGQGAGRITVQLFGE